jgi:hypothetical protein
VGNRIVLPTSLDPFLDAGICPGAVRCLGLLLRSLAGHTRTLRTLTSSLARQLRRCPNTIRNYRDQLVEALINFTESPRRRPQEASIKHRTAVMDAADQQEDEVAPARDTLPDQERETGGHRDEAAPARPQYKTDDPHLGVKPLVAAIQA